MYYITPPSWLRLLYGKKAIWELPDNDKVFLTFDDGPDPVITPQVLDILKKYNVKATFFCIGKNLEKFPEVYKRIIKEGHAIGNHSFDHLNGFQTRTSDYLANVEKAAELIKSDLFRPPYGRIKPRQLKLLAKSYTVFLWSVLSGDFDLNLNAEDCTNNVLTNVKPGSIIVYHDSAKAAPRMSQSLPVIIEEITMKKNLEFGKLYPLSIRTKVEK